MVAVPCALWRGWHQTRDTRSERFPPLLSSVESDHVSKASVSFNVQRCQQRIRYGLPLGRNWADRRIQQWSGREDFMPPPQTYSRRSRSWRLSMFNTVYITALTVGAWQAFKISPFVPRGYIRVQLEWTNSGRFSTETNSFFSSLSIICSLSRLTSHSSFVHVPPQVKLLTLDEVVPALKELTCRYAPQKLLLVMMFWSLPLFFPSFMPFTFIFKVFYHFPPYFSFLPSFMKLPTINKQGLSVEVWSLILFPFC